MKQLRLLFLLATFAFCATGQSHESCHRPSQTELKQFFSDESQWTEVKNKESHHIATRKVLRLNLNFADPQKSEITKGGKSMGGIEKICLADTPHQIKVVTDQTNIDLTKHKNGSLSTQLRFFGFTFTYYYRPDQEVIKSHSSHSRIMGANP